MTSGPLLQPVTKGGADIGFMHWCPGCRTPHVIYTRQHTAEPHPMWTFDGNPLAPTFSPSIRVRWQVTGEPEHCCHYFIRAGRIEFCADSTHGLKGQTVPLVPAPESSS